MLNVQGVSRHFGSTEVLRSVSFKLAPGSLNGLIGPGGSGKSVLLKVLGGVYEPNAGRVSIDDGELEPDQVNEGSPIAGSQSAVQSLSLMFQEGALFDSLSVYDNVAFPLVQGMVPTTALPSDVRDFVHERVTAILERVGLSKAIFKFPAQLSGGMRKRVSLARALVGRPKYVFLDDPTAGLDPVASSVIMNLIVELHTEYRPTTVLVSQDLRRLLPVVERIFALFGGKIVFSGSLGELRQSPDELLRKFVSCRFDLH